MYRKSTYGVCVSHDRTFSTQCILIRSSPRVAVRFVFTFIQRLVVPPTLPRGHPIAAADPSASLRYPEPPRFHGRPRNGVSDHTKPPTPLTHATEHGTNWLYQPREEDSRDWFRNTVTDTSRETGVAPWLRSEIARDSPRVRFWSLSRVQTRTTGIVFLWILICKRTWPAVTIATTANTAGTCWYDLALVIESVFEARVQGRRTINRGVETSHRDDTLWHPPKGAPREPSTSCCQSCRAAAMARASRSQRLRRRHPSHAGDVVAAIPGPYLSYTIFFKSDTSFPLVTSQNFI